VTKPQCCEDRMSFIMDNKVKELFECLHCGKFVLIDKHTKEEIWLCETISPHSGKATMVGGELMLEEGR